MKFKALFVSILALLFGATAYAGNDSAAGLWQTYDNDTGKPASLVTVTVKDKQLSGVITKVMSNPDATCTACTGDLQNKPLVGLPVLSGFTQDGSAWKDGKILAPKKGKAYNATITLSDDNTKMMIKVKVGFLSKTQTWQRADSK